MVYTPLTKKAMVFAYIFYNGKVDKGGVPYIYHPIHLAEQMNTELECVCALLHDVIEDTSVTLEELSKDFPKEVILVLDLLTHDKGTTYMDYIRRLSFHPVAKKIKIADLIHNSDISRLVNITDKDRKRIEKYQNALSFLKGEVSSLENK